MSPKVSVVVPVYESEEGIETCLASLVAQSFADLEILCVNAGSMDNSVTLIRRFMRVDSRVKLVNLDAKASLAAARNEGVRRAQGAFLQFVDGNGRLLPRALETAVALLEKSGAGYVFSASLAYDSPLDDNGSFKDPFYSPKARAAARGGPLDFRDNPALLVDIHAAPCLALRRVSAMERPDWFLENGAFPEEHLHYVYGFRSGSAVYCETPLYAYRRDLALPVQKIGPDDFSQLLETIEDNAHLLRANLSVASQMPCLLKMAMRLIDRLSQRGFESPEIKELYLGKNRALLSALQAGSVSDVPAGLSLF